jgi:uncharacterized protein (TIGR03437 family)
MSCSTFGQTYTIDTVAGTGFSNGRYVAVDAVGSLFVADPSIVYKVSNGVITTVAGGGAYPGLGDNGPATSAQFFDPGGIALDSVGNLYIAVGDEFRIRKVSNGVITTVAGNGTQGFSGDNGPATSAQLSYPSGVAADSAGNLYIADQGNNRIRKVSSGVITTVAGNGTQGFSGDNGPAANAQLYGPEDVTVDSAGNLYITDFGNSRIRKVSNGVITTVAGSGATGFGNGGFSGDNGPATNAQLNGPGGVAVDSAGNLYIADGGNSRIRKVSNGVITTVAGNGTRGYSGDNGPATSAQLAGPVAVAADPAGNVYIADGLNDGIRILTPVSPCTYSASPTTLQAPALGGYLTVSIQTGASCPWAVSGLPGWITVSSASSGTGSASVTLVVAPNSGTALSATILVAGVSVTITEAAAGSALGQTYTIYTVAGNGVGGYSGDNGPATSAQLYHPVGVAVDSGGNLYVADYNNSRIRKVSNGVITTVAGNGTVGYSGDNGPATSAQLSSPQGVAVDSAGNLYIADVGNNRVRKVSNGVITTVAGTGPAYPGGGFGGDGGPATSAQLYWPVGVAVDSAGNLYIADLNNERIRRVSKGVITTVAGSATLDYSGDNGPATSAGLSSPQGVAVDSAGNLYIADYNDSRIRRVSNGVITTVAGNGTGGYGGDGGPATSAELYFPNGVAVDSAGNLYIADSNTQRIRKVANGVITTVAGNGTVGYSGDNGPATSAQLHYPMGVAVDSAGNIYIADDYNSRIRILTPCAYSVGPTVLQAPASGGTLTVGIQTTASCPWTVSSLPGWITVSGASSGAGSATVSLVVSPNLGAPLSATMLIANLLVTVTQAVATVTASPASLSFAYQAGGNIPTPASITVTGSANGLRFSATATALSGGNWLSVSPSSGVTPGSVSVSVYPSGLTANTYNGTVVVGGAGGATGLTTINVALMVTAPLPTIKGVTNAASYAIGAVSPGELVTIFGTAIGPATAAGATTDPATGKLATTIGGVQVLFNGTAAPMIYASTTQVSAVVPYEMASVASPGVWIKYAGQASNSYQLTTTTTVPGLFTQNASGSGPGAILNQDNSVNGPGNRAAKGSIVQVFMTGEGQTSPPSVTGAITNATLPPPQVTPAPLLAVGVTINGQPALYVYAGEAPSLVAGMMQLNVQIPANAPSGDLAILVSVGGHTSQNGVTISVQ